MLGTLPLVALGGAIGASLRYLAGVGVVRAFGHTGFPLGVIGVNILGSFLMGLFVSTAALKGWGHWNPFVATGILGGFTTFSAFSLEAMTLYERGESGLALAYVLLSVILSIAGLACGLWVGRGAFA